MAHWPAMAVPVIRRHAARGTWRQSHVVRRAVRRRCVEAHCRTGTGLAPCHICAGTGLSPCHICAGTGLTPWHICAGTSVTTGLTPCHICAGTGLTPTHVCTGTAQSRHICTGTQVICAAQRPTVAPASSRSTAVYCLAMSARTSALSGRKRGTATSPGEYCFGFGQSGIDLPVHYVARARNGTAAQRKI